MRKDRNLPLSEFFENLQKEYICAELRSKIFQDSYSQYWKKVMAGKKEKILDIASRNRFLSIFDNTIEYNRVYCKVVPEWGLPSFRYISEVQRQKIENWDKLLYFSKGSEVKVLQEDNSYTVGTIVDNYNILDKAPRVEVRLRSTSTRVILPVDRISKII